MPEFTIFTWGSCRYGEVEILYPRNLKLSSITNRRGKHIVDLGALVIEYDNQDSRRNLHRNVKIVEVREPIVIRYYGFASCSRSFEEVWIITFDGARQLKPEEIKEEVKTEENGKYRYEVLERYIELNGNRIVISRDVLKKEPIMEKLQVKARIEGNKIVVYGDTFHVRDVLKSMKFRWDYINKVWWVQCDNDIDVEYTLEELEVRLKEKGVGLVIENVQEH